MACVTLLSLALMVACPTLAFRMSLRAGQPCQMRSGEAGVCQPAHRCPSVGTYLQKYGKWPLICSFQGREPVVCCESRARYSLPDPVIATPFLKSQQACQAYANELSPRLRMRVRDGEHVIDGEMPHMVALGFVRQRSTDVSWDCAGSLISDRYVLTAAHCLKRRNWRLVTARFGSVELTSNSEDAQEVAVAEVTLHPEFRPPYNDIALVRIARALKFSETLAPACLYTQPSLPRDALIVAGWGATDQLGGDKSNFLLKAEVQGMGMDRCNVLHKSNPLLRNGVVESMLCANDPHGNKGTCSGDSGGPLQVMTDSVNMYSIIGVTSVGPSICGSSIPTIYTKVSHYVPWIENIVWA